VSRKVNGPVHQSTFQSAVSLAWLYANTGEFAKAEPIARDQLAVADKLFKHESPQAANALRCLSVTLLGLKRYADAEPVLRESLAVHEKTQAEDWTIPTLQSMLGESLFGQKRYAEAEPLLLRGYTGMRDLNRSRDKLAQAVTRLVRLYEAIGRPDEAREWRAKLPPVVAPPPQLKQSP